MKLAFCLFKYFPYGGLERDFLRIALACQQREHIIHVFTMSWEGAVPDGIKLHLIPGKSLSSHGRTRNFVNRVLPLIKKKFDLVIGFNKMPGLDLYYAADTCYQAKARQKHSWLYRLTPRFRHFVEYEAAVFDHRSNTKIMMISDTEKPLFKRYYNTPDDHLHWPPPGISRNRMAPDNKAEIRQQWRMKMQFLEDESILLMIGSDFKRKGLDRSLLGLASLPEIMRKKTRLLVIGEDTSKPFERLAEQLDIASRLKIYSGRDDIHEFLLGADLLLHPAREENTGTVLLEAIVAGLPLLVSGACGYAFHVERAQAGKVLPMSFQQSQFNEALHTILISPEKERWAQNGILYGRTEDLYSLPEAAVDLIEGLVF